MQGHGASLFCTILGLAFNVPQSPADTRAWSDRFLLIVAGGVAHVWGRPKKRLRAAGQEPEKSK